MAVSSRYKVSRVDSRTSANRIPFQTGSEAICRINMEAENGEIESTDDGPCWLDKCKSRVCYRPRIIQRFLNIRDTPLHQLSILCRMLIVPLTKVRRSLARFEVTALRMGLRLFVESRTFLRYSLASFFFWTILCMKDFLLRPINVGFLSLKTRWPVFFSEYKF